jgi:hypothetical protein
MQTFHIPSIERYFNTRDRSPLHDPVWRIFTLVEHHLYHTYKPGTWDEALVWRITHAYMDMDPALRSTSVPIPEPG